MQTLAYPFRNSPQFFEVEVKKSTVSVSTVDAKSPRRVIFPVDVIDSERLRDRYLAISASYCRKGKWNKLSKTSQICRKRSEKGKHFPFSLFLWSTDFPQTLTSGRKLRLFMQSILGTEIAYGYAWQITHQER